MARRRGHPLVKGAAELISQLVARYGSPDGGGRYARQRLLGDMKNSSKLTPGAPTLLSEELIKALEARYFMFTKNRFITFLGGAFGFLILVGIISWKVTLTVLKSEQGKLSLAAIQREAEEAQQIGRRLQELKAQAETDAVHTVELVDARIARANQLAPLTQQKASLQQQIAASQASSGGGIGGAIARARLPELQRQLKAVENQIAQIQSER